ncbi:unnamed protein product [Alopecurus aequalis]
MAQKRAVRRGRQTVSGSKDSVELGRNGEYRPAKKPSPEGVEGSQSDHVQMGSQSADEETAIRALAAMAAARDGPPRTTAPPNRATAESASSSEDDAGEIPSKYSTSRRREGMAKKLPPSEEEEEEESEEESTEAPDPSPQLKRKRASDTGRVTRSQQRKVPAPEGAQPSKSKKPKSKKITPAPLQQRLSESEMPKSKKIIPAPLQQRLSESEMPKSKKITPAPLQQQGEERAQPSESEMPKSKRIRRIWTPSDEVRILTALVEHRRKQGKLPAPDNNSFFDSIAKRLEDKSCIRSDVKDKVRSLMRRYKSYVVPTTDHEKRLHDLSNSVWGDLPATHTANGNNDDGEQDEGEHAMAEAENGGGHTLDKSFEEMCEMYPLLGQEVKRLAGVQPALRSSFIGLDGKKARLMENKLGKLKWKELKIQAEMEAKVEAPKARVRKQLVNFLSGVSKNL